MGISASSKPAAIALDDLDNLWFQLAGTVCNLSCSHCFISCSPDNDSFGFLNRETVRRYLDEAKTMGVKEFYFTGGETFLNKEIYGILEDALEIGPASVLTNGTVIRHRVAEKLKRIADGSIYSLELRVSLDGFSAATNDKLRGEGSFVSALKGIEALVEAGFLPIITMVRTWSDLEHVDILNKFKALLSEIGYTRPRLKIIPALNLGAYKRTRTDEPLETIVTEELLENYDRKQLICSNSRMVTDKGVYVCPILIDFPDANLGATIAESARDYSLSHKACYTCYKWGAICSNYSSAASESNRINI